jgi:ubiquitin carboxyl-terminal hydrolase 9/13
MLTYVISFSYCNSVLQCLYYSPHFRENILRFPERDRITIDETDESTASDSGANGSANGSLSKAKGLPASPVVDSKKKPIPATTTTTTSGTRPEDNKDSPEYKKKMALQAGPILTVDKSNAKSYGMSVDEYTAMKDLFESIAGHSSPTGVLSPQKFIEVLKAENPFFQGNAHQDAHEFLMLVLEKLGKTVNDSIEAEEQLRLEGNGETKDTVSISSKAKPPKKGNWVSELFGGTLRSETKCLTCESVSRRDEPFNDLSIDMEPNSSLTTCLRNFCGSEILCEGNKFHCDNCGGLQEAEKRARLHKLPPILCLHLKRFKYMEDLNRHSKLFDRVPYPLHLRVWSTTDESADVDKLYELYGVIVHIGAGPVHGHYVAVIKTQHRGWLLFDDEMVEPVEKSYLNKFFGDNVSQAAAYVLFYQETTMESVMAEQEAESVAQMKAEEQAAPPTDIKSPITAASVLPGHIPTHPIPQESSPDRDRRPSSDILIPPLTNDPAIITPGVEVTPATPKSKKERQREEKAARAALKEREKQEKLDKAHERELEMKRRDLERFKRNSDRSHIVDEHGHRLSRILYEFDPKDNGKSYTDFANESNSGNVFKDGLSRFKPSSKSLSGRTKLWGLSRENKAGEEERELHHEAVSPLLTRNGHDTSTDTSPRNTVLNGTTLSNGTISSMGGTDSSTESLSTALAGNGLPLSHYKTEPTVLPSSNRTGVDPGVSPSDLPIIPNKIPEAMKDQHSLAYINGNNILDQPSPASPASKEKRHTSLRQAFGFKKKIQASH